MRETLTNREREVYLYLLKGLSYLEIADNLSIGVTTVTTHAKRVYLKKLVNGRKELLLQRIEELEQEVENLKRTNCITRVR